MPAKQEKLPGIMAPIVIVFAALSSAICIFLYISIPRFEQTFSSFGTDLPLLTELVLDYHSVFLGLPIIILGVGVVAALTRGAQLCYLSLGFSCLSILYLPLVMLAVYWPIFELGSVA